MAETHLKDQLIQLGFDMSGEVIIKFFLLLASQITNVNVQALDILFPHHLSHYIGLDVHDTPGQTRKAKLVPRQCVTIEP